MLYDVLKTVHLLSLVLWVGGMMFIQWFLRPALMSLATDQRIILMHEVMRRFFGAVLVAAVLILGTGVWMMGRIARALVEAGGSFAMPITWSIMSVVGLLMIGIFLFIRFALYNKLGDAIKLAVWDKAGGLLKRIRVLVQINLVLGIALICVVTLG